MSVRARHPAAGEMRQRTIKTVLKKIKQTATNTVEQIMIVNTYAACCALNLQRHVKTASNTF